MKLVPPDPEVDLYNDGFEPDEEDVLNRRAVGQSLSRLLTTVETPLVVALDGQWGTGKTYFFVTAHPHDSVLMPGRPQARAFGCGAVMAPGG